MKRIRLTVAYDGTNYRGWQIQPNGDTIEAEMNRALTELLGVSTTVVGASRTDSGVHALGNVAVFDTDSRMPADKFCFALNQRLPEDIRVLKSDEVPVNWHPRRVKCTKIYEYKIQNRRIFLPTERLYSAFCYYDLNLENMQEAARYLVGEHDFQSFCTAGAQVSTTVRTVYSVDIKKEGDLITIRIRGNGFLYNMVRIIVGTLLRVGSGLYAPEQMREILEAHDRTKAGETAPARGLTLVEIHYEEP